MKWLTITVFCFFGSMSFSQSINVWKIGDLEKRIRNSSDTTYIVNFWATWCAPCVKELPAFDSIQIANVHKKIKVLLVSLDFKEDIENRVIPFIKKKQVQSEVVILDEINGNYFIPKISSQWSGALPATWIIHSNKSIDRFFEKTITLDFLKNELKTIP